LNYLSYYGFEVFKPCGGDLGFLLMAVAWEKVSCLLPREEGLETFLNGNRFSDE
jgi:hypothetical protein